MRIGIFTDAYLPNISGVVTSVQMLYQGLTDLGHDVYIFTVDTYSKNDQRKYENKNIVFFKGHKVPIKSIKTYRVFFSKVKKARKVRSYNLDIIHIQTEFSMGRLGLYVGKKYNIPVVYTLHTLYEDYLQYISKRLDKNHHDLFLSKCADLLIKPIDKVAKVKIVPTNKVLKHVSKYDLTGNIKVVPTGLDLEKFEKRNFNQEDIKKIQLKYNISDDCFVFLSIGRISKEKSLDIVVKSFAVVEKSFNAKLLIVGDGPDMNDLKNLSNQLGINDKIIFTGFIPWDEVPIYYQLGDVFVNASVTETQGLTYIEALASSIPLLVQKDECLDGVVEDNVNGIFFDGDCDLKEKMKFLLLNQDVLNTIKKNTQKSVEKYSKKCYARNVLEIYKESIEIKNKQ